MKGFRSNQNKRVLMLFSLLSSLWSAQIFASTGSLFNVSASGTSYSLNMTLCLNGQAGLSCQKYTASASNLKIKTTIPNRAYASVGIKINTPGYTLSGCRPIANGYCLFSANDTTPANITVSSTTAFTVGGVISGLTGTVVLQNNGTNTTSISTDGSFDFSTPLAVGSSYDVTVLTQPANQTCSVVNGSGTMDNANISDVKITCATHAYSVGGTVSGLGSLRSVTLQNNGKNVTIINTDGNFTFSEPIAEGSTYAVTVLKQPETELCTVNNASGVMGGANVNNVTVTCSSTIYTVGGTITGLNSSVILKNNDINRTPINTNGNFTFSIPLAAGSSYNVTVQTQPTEQTCTITNGSGTNINANVTNVSVSCASVNTTISVSSKGVIPVGSGTGSLTVTNTGTTHAAYNVSAILPSGWTHVTQDASDCSAILPGASCTLTFTATQPYVAQKNISITGLNISSSPTTALAFSIDNYLVWSVSGSSPSAVAQVIASSNTSNYQAWSVVLNNISGITETSVAPPCNGATDGFCNTHQIENHYGTPYTNYAAGLCYQIISDNSGSVINGTWYLPAVCQMGGANQGAGCPSGLANIDANLAQLGFSGLGDYWTSTEYAAAPSNLAWGQAFVSGGGSYQVSVSKGFSTLMICGRTFTY